MIAGAPAQTADVGLCYQSTVPGSPVTNFFGAAFAEHGFTIQRATYSVAATTVAPGTGTYNVGMCVRNNGPSQIKNNNFVNGWVMVTNQ